MITALVKWRLAPGITAEQAIERFKQSTHYYVGLPGLVRKYIAINREKHFGYGIYLWHDQDTAEAFYTRVTPVIREETGSDPEIEFFDTPIIVDNLSAETLIYELPELARA